MSKRFRDPDSDGTTATASGFKTVFVTTSLDTHLALSLTFSDTVADFKRKILLNHEQCFPEIGALTIHSLKVKYHGKLYHLQESDMVVSSVFEGSERRWSLFVDASSSLKDVKEQSSFNPYDKGKFDSPRVLQAIDAIAWKSPGESSRHTGLEVGHVDGTSREGFKRSLDVAGESALNTAPHTTTTHRSNHETAGVEDSFVGIGSKVSRDVQIGVIDAGDSPYNTLFSGKKTSGSAAPESHVFEQEEVYRHHLDLGIRNQVSDMENVAPEKSDMENVAQEKSVVDRRENMTSSNVPSEQLHEEQEHPAVNMTTKKKKRKKQHNGTNSYIPDETETMLQGSVLQEACGSQVIGTGNYGKEDDKSMLAPTASQNDYMKDDGRLISNSDMLLSESVKPSNIVKATPAKKELVVCLGILNNSSEVVDSGKSKSKIRKEPALDVALTVMENLEGGKSGCSRKKRKKKKSATHNDYCVVERTKDTNDTLVLKVVSDVLADQSIFSCIKGKEASKMFSPTNSHKNDNTASDDDNVHLPLTEVDHIYSKNEDLDLNSGKESNINQSQVRASIHDQVNMEQAKEAECLPMDQPDGELEKKGTTKKKKERKAKRTGNSTGEGLVIPEVNQQTLDDKEVASLIVNLGNVDTLKVSGSDEKETIDCSGASELGHEKNAGLKCSGELEPLVQSANVPEVPSHQIGNNCEVGHAAEVEPNNAFASKGENGLVNFRRYFVPGEDHREAVSTDMVEGESNVVEGAEKADDSKHEYSSSKERQRKNVTKKEISTSSKKKLEENDGSLTSSTFNSVSSDSKMALVNKSSHKKLTGIHQELSRKKESDLEKSSQEKGLITTPGVIFGDGHSESSGDENWILKSGSTTLSPSDSSSSSGDSMKEGSNNSARDHEGRKTALSSKKPNPGSMSIDMVLRSSNRFKKAKLYASQSEAADSEESQQVDFVPESQPIL